LAICTAGRSEMSCLSLVAISSREHSANVRHSVNPAIATPDTDSAVVVIVVVVVVVDLVVPVVHVIVVPFLSRSVILLRANYWAMQLVVALW